MFFLSNKESLISYADTLIEQVEPVENDIRVSIECYDQEKAGLIFLNALLLVLSDDLPERVEHVQIIKLKKTKTKDSLCLTTIWRSFWSLSTDNVFSLSFVAKFSDHKPMNQIRRPTLFKHRPGFPFTAVFFGLLFCVVPACAQWLEPEESSATHTLKALLIEGPELHPTLQTVTPGKIHNLPAGVDFKINPEVSDNPLFIHGVARGGSQGRLDGSGMLAALYARYSDGSSDIGFYGLQAQTEQLATEREQALRDIWAHNNRLDRTHVYRKDNVLLVVWIWSKGELPEAWLAVKQWAELNTSKQ